jgi:hypothetical protein
MYTRFPLDIVSVIHVSRVYLGMHIETFTSMIPEYVALFNDDGSGTLRGDLQLIPFQNLSALSREDRKVSVYVFKNEYITQFLYISI